MPYDPEHAAERAEGRKWQAALDDINKQVQKVIEIGNIDLAQWVAAAILDCIIDFKAGKMPEASRTSAMRLTPSFSRVKADGAFLHEENMNLPLQEEEEEEGSFLEEME